MQTQKTPMFTESSGNVFADLEFEEAEMELAISAITSQLEQVIVDLGLSRTQAAELLEVDMAELNSAIRGQTRPYAFIQLAQFLMILGFNVDLAITRAPKGAKGQFTAHNYLERHQVSISRPSIKRGVKGDTSN